MFQREFQKFPKEEIKNAKVPPCELAGGCVRKPNTIHIQKVKQQVCKALLTEPPKVRLKDGDAVVRFRIEVLSGAAGAALGLVVAAQNMSALNATESVVDPVVQVNLAITTFILASAGVLTTSKKYVETVFQV